MSTPLIKPKEIVDALEIQGEQSKSYLNRQTGEVVTLSIEELSAAEEGEALEDFPEWQQENIRTAREIVETDHYLQLPSQFDVHEWSIMRDFCDTVQGDRLREQLLDSIHGKGAFRHFKDTLHRHGIEENWYRYRANALLEIAKGWLEEHNLAYEGADDEEEENEEAQIVVIPPKLQSIDHVQLAMPANEEEKARAFYAGILGLEEVAKPPNLTKRGGVWFEFGSVKVHLGVEENFHPAKKAHPAFRVEGWETLIARCQAAGYAIIPDDQIPGVRRAYVHDPFGNRIELIDSE